MNLFTPNAPLEFVAIDILGGLISTKRGNRYILVISDRYSKLVRTVPLKKITAAHIVQAFVHHWIFVYGPPVKFLSDIGTQFTARFFQNICRILRIRIVFTTTYHLQANGQVERYNRTLTSALRKYDGEHPKDSDLFSDAVTFAYNTQVHNYEYCALCAGTSSSSEMSRATSATQVGGAPLVTSLLFEVPVVVRGLNEKCR